MLHFRDIKAYALLITFQKTEKEFSPTTMYADYPISRSLLHWESQSNTALDSPTGQNLVHHQDRGLYHPGVCPAEEKTQPVHGAVRVFRTGQACQPSKRTAHPDGMAAAVSHACGDV
ncbi:DUF3427 domain-containing protein [Desulfotignum phosphitoxidans]|uniref:DUF3427 domain-containing protein n=1 Tax=Desulfotignum phosphitoxidans TaxID=190898 RepID=UPI00034B2F6B|nr:DUF3427 domain-containing protein [Desulfotignum phosphitoxidans]